MTYGPHYAPATDPQPRERYQSISPSVHQSINLPLPSLPLFPPSNVALFLAVLHLNLMRRIVYRLPRLRATLMIHWLEREAFEENGRQFEETESYATGYKPDRRLKQASEEESCKVLSSSNNPAPPSDWRSCRRRAPATHIYPTTYLLVHPLARPPDLPPSRLPVDNSSHGCHGVSYCFSWVQHISRWSDPFSTARLSARRRWQG